MTKYQENLQDFLDKKCEGDFTNCVECPGGHHKDGACAHPDHPSMQPVKTEFDQPTIVHPAIADVLHKIRNTYQALYAYHGTPEGEEKPFTSEKIMDFLHNDIALMADIEKTCKACTGGK